MNWNAVDHIKVTDPTFGEGEHLAVELALANPFIYHVDGSKTHGREILFGIAARKRQRKPQAAASTRSPSRLGAAGDSDAAAQDGLCVSKAFSLLGWDLWFGPDLRFERLPYILDEELRMGRKLALNKKVGSWGYPGLKDWSRRGSNFEFDAIHIICAHAKPADKLLLRVLVPKSHTSLHCVAVWNGVE